MSKINVKEMKYMLLDGGMGTMLQSMGMEMGTIPETLGITKPEWILDIHRQYVKAGAQVIYANTFSANRYKLEHCEYSVCEIIQAAVKNAKKACEGTDCLVALDIGPIGQLLEPTGSLSFEEAYDIFKEELTAGAKAGADFVVFETMTDLLEMKAAVLAAKENTDLPIFCTMTFEENGRTFTGCSVSAMALTLEGLGVDALGLNCSLGPKQVRGIVEEFLKWTTLPIIVKPNAGLPDPVTNKYDVSPEEFCTAMEELAHMGVQIFGGCCGTTPEFIRQLSHMLRNQDFVIKRKETIVPAAVCTYANTVCINQPRIIGERINPTGKKLFKEALKNKDMDYILNQAIEQVHGGAEILDVNVGLPGINEKEMMVAAVKAIQGIVDVPLQLDSTIPEVLEAALRVYNGKPIVNSVNGEEKSMEAVLPLVKKYGAAVVGLTIDEEGIPPKAKGRIKIAKKILNRALAMGIPKENVYIDCLTLTASAQQEGVMETLEALKYVKEELGLKTVLGVSNISFGLPNRESINHTFLTMAMMNGLDLPIMNPNIASMASSVRAFRLLKGYDVNSAEYIQAYKDVQIKTAAIATGVQKEPSVQRGHIEQLDLMGAVEHGLKTEGAKITRELLKSKDAMEIINHMLIPALDKAGAQFETGKIFLPQLILSAGVAQAAFEEIKKHMSHTNQAPVSKGKIVLATVKGDIHDIGKNIVKVLLENYGYTVIDLGKDVEYQAVVDAVTEHQAKLVGLSALMTTTLVSMEKTIALIHENKLDCKIVVGGAVLTPEYAKQIHADFYAKDAKETVDIAKQIIG